MANFNAALQAERAILRKKNEAKEEKQLEKEAETESGEEFNYTGGNRFSGGKNIKLNKSKIKKLAPILIFLIVIISAFALIFGTNSLLPGHINANTIEAFDITSVATKIAEGKLTEEYLKTGSLPSTFASALTDSGLEVGYIDKGNNYIAGLRPQTDANLASYQVIDNKDLDHSLVLKFKDNLITYANFEDYFYNDTDFYKAFSAATNGRAQVHFNETANNFYSTIENTSRNLFRSYKSTGNIEEDTKSFREAYKNLFKSVDTKVNTVIELTEEDFGIDYSGKMGSSFYPVYGCYKEGSKDKYTGIIDGIALNGGRDTSFCPCTTVYKIDGGNSCNVPKKYDENGFLIEESGSYESFDLETIDTPDSAAQKFALIHGSEIRKQGDTYFATLSSNIEASSGSDSFIDSLGDISYSEKNDNGVDADYKASMILGQAVSNSETSQYEQIYLAIEEIISKTMAGDGSNAPINPLLNALTSEVTTVNASGEEVKGAALTEPGLAAVLTKTYNTNLSESTSSSSVDRAIEKAKIAFLELTDTRIATTEGVSLESDSSLKSPTSTSKPSQGSFISDFGCYFIGKIGDINSKAAGTIISMITPQISQSVLFGKADELSGQALGAAIAAGGSSLGNKFASYVAGGSTGTSISIARFNSDMNTILALDASADRASRSPFDITSKNTFLGSIVSKFGNTLAVSNGFLSMFSNMNNLALNSFALLVPGAFAEGEDLTFQTSYGTGCEVSNIGAEGNIYCIPTITFDTDYINIALSDSEFDSFLERNLETKTESSADGSETEIKSPKANSDLGLYLAYNNGRQSHFGQKNNNIYNSLVDENGNITEIPENIGQVSDGSILDWFGNLFSSIGKALSNFFSSIVNLFSKSYTSSGSSNVSNEAKVRDSYNDAREERVERISTGEEFVNDGGEKWNGAYKYAQAYSLYSFAAECLGMYSEENTNNTTFSQYFIPASKHNPASTYVASTLNIGDNETDAEYLSRISGLTLEEANFAMNYAEVTTFLANFDYESLYRFSEDQNIDSSKLSLKETDDTLDSSYILPNFINLEKERTTKISA